MYASRRPSLSSVQHGGRNDWDTVLALYEEIKIEEREAREPANEVRRTAWHAVVGHNSGSAPFWRHGFAKRFGRRVDLHDYTAVPGYDEIAQEIATIFPEYAHDSGTEELFAFLFSPYNRLPSREEMFRKAFVRAAYCQYTPQPGRKQPEEF